MAKSFSKRWQNGEISNFQYIMHLNTLAGRGYSDLTQYPVFPWVLADYDSETLNFSDPKTFRKLDKSMGCQTLEGEEEFRKRLTMIFFICFYQFNYPCLYRVKYNIIFLICTLFPSHAHIDTRAGMIQKFPSSIMVLIIQVLELFSSTSCACPPLVMRI